MKLQLKTQGLLAFNVKSRLRLVSICVKIAKPERLFCYNKQVEISD